MKRVPEAILRWKKPIIAATAALTIFLGYGLSRLTINSDIISYLKPGDPAVVLFDRIGEEYAGNLNIFTIVKSDDIFRRETLAFIGELTELYAGTEGVASVTSLANIIDIRGTEWGLEIGKLLEPGRIPESREELAELRSYVLDKEIYRGKIVSEDGTASIIVSRVNPRYNKIDVAKAIRSRTEAVKGARKVQYSGYPIQMAELSRFLMEDLLRLIPVVVVVIVAVLFASFRTGRGVLLPLSIVLISTVWTLGFMGYAGVPLTIMSNIVPVVLLAIGTAYGIHFLARYDEDVRSEESKNEDMRRSIATVGLPIIMAGLTTIIGFLSFVGAYLTAITEFGLFTALGVLFAMVLSLTFLPAVLSLMRVKGSRRALGSVSRAAGRDLRGKAPLGKAPGGDAPKSAATRGDGAARTLGRFMEGLGTFVTKRRRLIVIASMAAGAASIFAIPLIRIETQLTTYFPLKSDVRQAEATIEEEFGGSIPLQVVVKGDLKNPAVLRKIHRMQKYMENLGGVNDVQSIADLVCRMNETLNGHGTVPETKAELANLLFLLEGEDVLEQLVKEDYREGVIQGIFGEGGSKARDTTVGLLRTYTDRELSGKFAVVERDALGEGQRRAVEAWLLDDVASVIELDMRSYGTDDEVPAAAIAHALQGLVGDRGPKSLPLSLGAEARETLSRQLTSYFEEESELWIDDERARSALVDAFLGVFSSKWSDRDEIVSLLRSRVPKGSLNGDPGVLDRTADHLESRLSSAQGVSFVETTAGELVDALYPRLAGDPKASRALRDDLWSLTEKTAVVPSALLEGSSGVVETIEIDAELGGMIVILEKLDGYLLKSQLQSVAIALVTVLILLSLQFRSLKMGIVTLSPIVLVTLFNFAILGFFGIPLDYATMLVGSILVGVGIDYSIHFTSRYNLERSGVGGARDPIVRSLGTTGRAIVVNAAMVAFGFFVLMGGNLIPLRRAGWITGALMILSASAALIYLPAVFCMSRKSETHTTRRTK